MSDGLTDKQRLFCERYIYWGNATKAYQEVYKNSSYNAARSSASVFLTKPNIIEYINHLKDNLASEAKITKLMVLLEAREIMFNKDNNGEINVKDRLKSIEIINKMLGFNEPDKTSFEVNDNRKTKEELELELVELRAKRKKKLDS